VRIFIDSLGCKLNQAEAERLARDFMAAGHELVSSPETADIYVLNTCTVTHIADRKSRHLLRLARRQNPYALVVATGCYAERAPEELARLEGVSLVVGNRDKPGLAQSLADSGYLSVAEGTTFPEAVGFRTRSFVKIQDGCANFCAYCIVPLVRGRETSLPASGVVNEIKARVAQGYREVVLTGVRIGVYRDGGSDLAGLVRRILAETDIERLRLSSLQPQELTPELLRLFRDGRLCPHLHLCLQSGSDSVLARMKRRYTTAEYRQAVWLAREAIPDVAITTDVMVGFPGETEAEFEESLSFCREMAFARIHVFSYSRRKGTMAAAMPGQVGDAAKRERSQRLLALAGESAQGFHRRFLGETMPVLFEQQAGGVWSGLTGNYIKVYLKSRADLTNQLLSMRLASLHKDGVWGEAPECEGVGLPHLEAFLDIETTGLSPYGGEITVIGIHLAGQESRFMQLVGDEISAEALLAALAGASVLYTYNGSRFDLPFIQARLGVDLTQHFDHRDLMYDCWRCNLYGGLKGVERQLDINREIRDVSGYDAVRLWWQYVNNYDEAALKLLLAYNREDVLNLRVLRDKLGEFT
jgi:threonylcarbamoyladenosine tRNA methylthiotransferase MtaB